VPDPTQNNRRRSVRSRILVAGPALSRYACRARGMSPSAILPRPLVAKLGGGAFFLPEADAPSLHAMAIRLAAIDSGVGAWPSCAIHDSGTVSAISALTLPPRSGWGKAPWRRLMITGAWRPNAWR
jgi:hypothetical protein